MVFGTAQDVSGLPSDAAELAMIAYVQKAWAAFARDPKQGLLKTMGWPKYDTEGLSCVLCGNSGFWLISHSCNPGSDRGQ